MVHIFVYVLGVIQLHVSHKYDTDGSLHVFANVLSKCRFHTMLLAKAVVCNVPHKCRFHPYLMLQVVVCVCLFVCMF